VTLLLDLTYNGRFQLAIDVDMVFGRSAYLSVMLTKLEGVARLQFTRLPFTHWSFTFTQVIMHFAAHIEILKHHFRRTMTVALTDLGANCI